jgi:hypothetical protein
VWVRTAVEGHDAPTLIDETVPSPAAVVNDVVVGGEGPVRCTVDVDDSPVAIRARSTDLKLPPASAASF